MSFLKVFGPLVDYNFVNDCQQLIIALFQVQPMQEMIEKAYQDGWDCDLPGDEHYIVGQESQGIGYRGEKGLSILQAKHHSLEPDMVCGWKPKLPSCPLPLSYPNTYTQHILQFISGQDLYQIAYRGPRYGNSVQVNQQHSYSWRYRDRYSLNLAIIQDSIRRVGAQEADNIKLCETGYCFSSSFQSGNLDLAVRIKKNQFDCFIRSDTNTKGHTNWYFFELTNNQQVGPVRLNICNMTKHRNLYSKGMKPYVKEGDEGSWKQQTCTDVIFVQRLCRYGSDRKNYQLQFTYNFSKPNQKVFFAYAIPYSYSDLEAFIKEIRVKHGSIVKYGRLCESLGGVDVPLLTIGQNIHDMQTSSEASFHRRSRKKAAIVTARIHPGQSNSSLLMQGFIRQLLDDSEQSKALREMFVFYIVPMLNPDGVIAGNFRTSYSGKDLNRQFFRLNKYFFPQITSLAELCQQVKASNPSGIEFYFDFHGHSAKKNLFCYGPEHSISKAYFFKSRALAKIIEKMSPVFSYRKSLFTISQQKKTTARAYMLKNIRIPMTFTFEISNGIYQDSNRKDILLDRSILVSVGGVLVSSLFKYAQLEMRMPRKSIKAKVDTGNLLKRHLKSASSAERSGILGRKNQNGSDDSRLGKRQSTGKVISSEKSVQQPRNKEENKQFLLLMKEIRQEQLEGPNDQEIEGRSDSESEADDFDAEETNKLFNQIMKKSATKRNPVSYVIRERKKSGKSFKIPKRKPESLVEDIENCPAQQNVPETRKIRSSRLIELSRPPMPSRPNLKRGASFELEKVVLAQKNFTLIL